MQNRQFLRLSRQKTRVRRVLEFDEFASSLLEESKRFLEKARSSNQEVGRAAYIHASILLAFCAFEAHLNAVAEEFSTDKVRLSLHERSLLQEKEVRLKNGAFTLTEELKIYRLFDRLLFLHQKFGRKKWNHKADWISALTQANVERNKLVHPKNAVTADIKSAERVLKAVVAALDALYLTIYKCRFPAAKRKLDSKLDF